jgi:hypothetical protein
VKREGEKRREEEKLERLPLGRDKSSLPRRKERQQLVTTHIDTIDANWFSGSSSRKR